MDEDTAHNLYLQFKAVDAGARQKQGLGFGSNGIDWKRQASTAFVKQRSRSPRGSSRALNGTSAAAAATGGGEHAARRDRSKSPPDGSGIRSSGGDGDGDRGRKGRDGDGNGRSKHKLRRRRSGSGSRERRRRGRRDRHSRRDESSRGRSPSRRSPSSRRGGSRSRSRSRSGSSRRRRRSHSRSRSKLRSRSGNRCRRSRTRTRSRSRSGGRRSRRDAEADDRRRSPRRRSEDRSRGSGDDDGGRDRPGNGRRGREAARRRRDPSELIPGYESMSTMEKMKARTRMTLDAAGRTNNGGEDKDRQWTRFVFNNSAPLEEEGARPEMTFGGDNGDGGPINAVSFRSGEAKARAKARDVSHEAAIFGSAPGAAHASGAAPQALEPGSTAAAAPTEPHLLGLGPDDAPTVVLEAEASAPSVAAASGVEGAAGTRAPSWRERVAQQRQQQQQQL